MAYYFLLKLNTKSDEPATVLLKSASRELAFQQFFLEEEKMLYEKDERIVLLSSESLDTLKVTHSNFFYRSARSYDELFQRMGESFPQKVCKESRSSQLSVTV